MFHLHSFSEKKTSKQHESVKEKIFLQTHLYRVSITGLRTSRFREKYIISIWYNLVSQPWVINTPNYIWKSTYWTKIIWNEVLSFLQHCKKVNASKPLPDTFIIKFSFHFPIIWKNIRLSWRSMQSINSPPCSHSLKFYDFSGNCKWCILRDHLPSHQTWQYSPPDLNRIYFSWIKVSMSLISYLWN